MRLFSSLRTSFRACGTSAPIVVVENDKALSIGEILQNFPELDVTVILEPRIGLTHARNRLLDWADGSSIEWLIGLDDDEWVSEGWFSEFHTSLLASPPPQLFMGPCRYSYGSDLSPFLAPEQFANPEKGAAPPVMTTQNYAIHRSLFGSAPDAGLRFHPAFNDTGGEDLEFFLRAKRICCAKAVWLPDAIVHEDRIQTRATLGYRIERSRRNQISVLRIDWLHWREFGYGNPVRNVLQAIAGINRNLVNGLAGLILGLILWPVDPVRGRRLIGQALRRLVRVIATVEFWLGRSRKAYGEGTQPN